MTLEEISLEMSAESPLSDYLYVAATVFWGTPADIAYVQMSRLKTIYELICTDSDRDSRISCSVVKRYAKKYGKEAVLEAARIGHQP